MAEVWDKVAIWLTRIGVAMLVACGLFLTYGTGTVSLICGILCAVYCIVLIVAGIAATKESIDILVEDAEIAGEDEEGL